jgi:hypothetical protein
VRVAPAPTRFTQNFCYAKASLTAWRINLSALNLANLSFRFIGVVGANYLTTIVRNTKFFMFLWNALPLLCYKLTSTISYL